MDVYSQNGLAEPGPADNWGPEPLQELYRFNTVDTWFANNPDTLDTQNGNTQHAVRHDLGCQALQHCPLHIRKRLQTCRVNVDRRNFADSQEACYEAAEKACGIPPRKQ